MTFSPVVLALFRAIEQFVRKSGAWAIIVNDLTRTFHVSSSYGLNSVLTAIAGSLIYADHVAAKKSPPTPVA